MTPGPPGQDKSGRLETVKNTKKVRIMIRLILVAVTLIGFLTLGYPLLAAQNSLGKRIPMPGTWRALRSSSICFP